MLKTTEKCEKQVLLIANVAKYAVTEFFFWQISCLTIISTLTTGLSKLTLAGEVAWILEKLRESSHARVTSVKSHNEHWVTDWLILTRQGNDRIWVRWKIQNIKNSNGKDRKQSKMKTRWNMWSSCHSHVKVTAFREVIFVSKLIDEPLVKLQIWDIQKKLSFKALRHYSLMATTWCVCCPFPGVVEAHTC